MMHEPPLVKVENASKKFARNFKWSLWYGIVDIINDLLGVRSDRALRNSEFWAVSDISFELRRGECLGLIGHNGAGKSTLLKMLNGLIKPDKGRIEIRGRIGALIELGAGFNPVLTGRENVFNYGTVLGFSHREIVEKYQDIVAFAEMEGFMETPVQNYSSGMKVRLGFAVAAQMEPDVLIIDEVLAVGDIGFRIKCVNAIRENLGRTATIFVTHSMPLLAMICNRGILMSEGLIAASNHNVQDIIEKYFDEFQSGEKQELGTGQAEVNGFQTENINREISQIFKSGDPVNVRFFCKVDNRISAFRIKIMIFDTDLRPITESDSEVELGAIQNNGDTLQVYASLVNLHLRNGRYHMTLAIEDTKTETLIFRVDNIADFTIHAAKTSWAQIAQPTTWSIVK
jgi:lipopolysaccharide transport system ATP-binding protein